MFRLMHEMRVRIMTSPSFTNAAVIAAILFERTMENDVKGKPVPAFLWQERGVVPFLNVDKGLAAEMDGVSLMSPIPGLDALLKRSVGRGVFGTKMRSVINLASKSGIAAIQQFEVADQISAHGLMPIIEPEISIKSHDKAGCEAHLRDALLGRLDARPRQIIRPAIRAFARRRSANRLGVTGRFLRVAAPANPRAARTMPVHP